MRFELFCLSAKSATTVPYDEVPADLPYFVWGLDLIDKTHYLFTLIWGVNLLRESLTPETGLWRSALVLRYRWSGAVPGLYALQYGR